MISLCQIIIREQHHCSEQFTEILRHPRNGTSEYGRSVDRRLPEDDDAVLGQIVFKGRGVDRTNAASLFFLPAYHWRSVIAQMLRTLEQRRSEYSACKLSERVSSVHLDIAGALFLLYSGFFFFFFTLYFACPQSVVTRTANPKGKTTKWN